MLASRSLSAFASSVVTLTIVAGLIGAGMVASGEKRKASKALTTIDLAALRGSEDAAETQPEEPVPEPAAAKAVEPATAPPAVAPPLPPPPVPLPVPQVAAQSAAAASPEASTHPAMASASAAMAATAAPPAPAKPALPAPRGVADGMVAKAPAGTSRAYAARVRTWLLSHKIYPKFARMRRIEGVVRVHFILDRAGRLIDGELVGRSGETTLDSEAEAMLRRASPYPSAPADVVGERISFTAAIEFKLDQ
jgi:periplasmic protein TonB